MRNGLILSVFILAVAVAWASGAVQGPPAPARADLATDKPMERKEAIEDASHDYIVDFRGAIDGAMTRNPMAYKAPAQGWQPNVFARIENTGDTDVVNPWITVNGKGDWRSIEKIVEEATRGLATDAERARALWEFSRAHRFHACTWDGEVDDVVKAYNVYGYTLCGDEGIVLNDLYRAAGFHTRPGRPIGHCVTEVNYDGAWHLLDSDESVICYLRDNKTVASEPDVVRDHDLMKRVHTYSISSLEDPLTDQSSASLYYFTGERRGEWNLRTKHRMDFTLRPGESIEWRWTHVGKEYSAGVPLKEGQAWSNDGTGTLSQVWGPTAYADMRNGKWTYRPPIDKVLYRKGIVSEENVACKAEDGKPGNLHPADPAKPAKITWKISGPYVMVGGNIQVQGTRKAAKGEVVVTWSTNGKDWQGIDNNRELTGGMISQLTDTIDGLLSPRLKPTYEYYVQLEMKGDISIDSIVFETDVQMSLLGMPELTVGENKIHYSDETKGERSVLVTHSWMERTNQHPPVAPAVPEFPADGATVEGTQFTFKWPAAAPGDADAAIADYHVQVSDRADLRWTFSPTFDRLISLTPQRGTTQWAIPARGLLNPDTDYFWRIRAKDSRGIWGAWSRAFKFRCAAPGVPVDLDITKHVLTWKDSPSTRKPIAWRIYGSNEQGFTASDTEYVVRMGHGFCDSMKEYNAKKPGDPFFGDVKTPSNFLAEVKERQFKPKFAERRAFYRVAAIDEKGNVSGPSDCLDWQPPSNAAIAGTVKVGQACTERLGWEPLSLGQLTCRGGYNAAFWEKEKLTFTLEKCPPWLKLEGEELRGTPGPDDVGAVDVIVTVESNKGRKYTETIHLIVEK